MEKTFTEQVKELSGEFYRVNHDGQHDDLPYNELQDFQTELVKLLGEVTSLINDMDKREAEEIERQKGDPEMYRDKNVC